MSHLSSYWRSNYFEVKDWRAFEKAIAMFKDQIDIVHEKEGTTGHIALFGVEGGFPNSYYEDYREDDIEFDWNKCFKEHLVQEEGNIVIVQVVDYQTSFSHLQSVGGCAFAINHKGEELGVNLDGIYDLVQEKWKIEKKDIAGSHE